MKKLLTLISTLTILLSFNADKPAPIIPARAADETTVHEYASDFMEYSTSGNPDDPYYIGKWPEANMDYLSHTAQEGTVEHLNYQLSHNEHFYNTGIYGDLIKSAAYLADEDLRLVYNQDASLSFIPANSYYLFGYYETIKPIIYFDSTIEGQKNLHFFIEPSVNKDAINAFIDLYDIQGSFPLFTINDKYQIITIEAYGTGKGFRYKTYYGSKIEMNYYQSQESTTAGQRMPCIKVTMPYIDSIIQIESLNMGFTDLPTSYVADNSFYFRMHADLANKYYYYAFDLCGFSAIQGHIIVDNSTYTDYYGYKSDFEAELVSMTFMYNHTEKKTVDIAPKKALGDNVTIVGNNIEITKFASEFHEVTFNPELGYVDGKVRYWCFDDQWKPGTYDAGEIKICEIKWKPRTGNTVSNTIEVHDYRKVNIHKYSFNASKSIRTYYYEMSGYSRSWSLRDNNLLYWCIPIVGPIIGAAKEAKYHFEVFGFNFFFDKQRTLPIPNVKKLVIKYQCGYKEPNSASGSNGWYPNGKDPRKDIIIRTLELSKVGAIGSYILDDYGMAFGKYRPNNDNKKFYTDDYGNLFDYAVYKEVEHKDVNTYISKMDNLEITYETENQESVRMVANSRGLHAVLDDDGSYRVYDSEGNPCEDYDVGISEDNTPFVGKDENGDGKIDTDEAIDSDTGTILQQVPTWDAFEKENNSFKNILSIVIGCLLLAAFLLIIAFNPGLIVKICKGIGKALATIGKAIGNAFKSLAKALKKRKSSKKKTTSYKKSKSPYKPKKRTRKK